MKYETATFSKYYVSSLPVLPVILLVHVDQRDIQLNSWVEASQQQLQPEASNRRCGFLIETNNKNAGVVVISIRSC